MIRELLLDKGKLDKLAVIAPDKTYTYRDLAKKAASVRDALASRPRGNIAIFLPNSADYICALFGVFMAGMTAFPLSVQLTAHEVAPLLERTGVETVITSAENSALFEGTSLIIMEELAADADPLRDIRGLPPGVPAILLATSGTTGSAKIVQLSEENIEIAVLGFITYNDYARFNDVEIRYILGAPFSSVYGLLILSTCIINAFPLVVTEGAFTLDTLYSAAEKYGVTHYEGGTAIPILMDQMGGKEMPYNIDTIRFVGFGGSKVSSDVLRRLDGAFQNIEFCPGYGMTESASLIARPYKRVKLDKRDSIGRAIPYVTVRVCADGVITGKPDTTGELVVRGLNVMMGYYGDEEATRGIIKNGWLYTGDIGYIDGDGDIFICGRKKNVIMVRGFSVYAEEVETVLQGSGLVKDCVVYGRTGDSGAETLCADIVPIDEDVKTQDIRGWCAKRLAPYKQPNRITFTDTLSKTVTGKTQRHEAD